MASCPSCGAETGASGGACPRCGRTAAASLELDVPARRPQKASQTKKKADDEIVLELAVDPRSLVQPPSSEVLPVSGPRARGGSGAAMTPVRSGAGPLVARREMPPAVEVGDIGFDAQLLADYGEPPGHWLLSALYAWKVLARQRGIKAALAGRRDEAARATAALEDALVAFAERAKPAAEKREAYAPLLAEAESAEGTLRSRDAVLAADQKAHSARLAAVESRVATLEAELQGAQSSERALVAELASSQGALGRAEAKLKRAESELRAATREGVGTDS
jgi:hypothetical protein